MIKHSLLALLASSSLAVAGSVAVDFKKNIIEPELEPVPSINRTEIKASGSWVGESGFRRGAGKFGEQGVYESRFTAFHRLAFSDRWYFKLGANYHRFDFSTSEAPLDTTLQGIAAIVGIEYVVNGQVGFFIESRPGVYFSDSISGDAFDAPTVAAVAFPVKGNSFFLVAGVSYTGFGNYPVLPVVGFKWIISPEWTLSAYLPEPKLIYSPNDTISFWAGGELTGGSYRTGEHSGGPDKIDHALVNYVELRAGGGVHYQVCSGFKIEAAAGYVFSRRFDYYRAGDAYGLEGAPYVKLGARAEF